MKTFIPGIFIFLLSFIYSSAVQAQQKAPFNPGRIPVDVSSKLFTYMEVIMLPEATEKQLLDRGLNWFKTFYKNPTDVIRAVDSLRGTINGKARFKIYNPPDKTGFRTDAGNVEYSIEFACKPGKFRYKVSDINWKQLSYFPAERWADTTAKGYMPNYLYYLDQTDSLINEITENLESFVKTPPAKKKDDW